MSHAKRLKETPIWHIRNRANSFSSTRDHPANEVYVTGTFDDWAKSVKLEKKGNIFEKVVVLPQAEENIYYKVCISRSCFLLTSIAILRLVRNSRAMAYQKLVSSKPASFE